MRARYTPADCPNCEYDRRFFEAGGWIQKESDGPIVPCPICNADGKHERGLFKQQIEAAAAAIGLLLGPPGDGSPTWIPSYRSQVKWPDDYTESERTQLRNAAIAALEAAMSATERQAEPLSEKE